MNDFQLTVKDVDDTRYDLEVIYKGKKYMKHITSAYLDTCTDIIKQNPHLLKQLLLNHTNDITPGTLEVINTDEQEKLKLNFKLHAAIIHEVEIYLDLVEPIDILKISTDEVQTVKRW